MESGDLLPRPFRSMRGNQDPASPQRIVSSVAYVVEYGIRHPVDYCPQVTVINSCSVKYV